MLQERLLGSVRILSVDYKGLLFSLREASSKIKRDHPQVENIFLFGSFSRGDYTPGSDVDILIVVKEAKRPFLQRGEQFSAYFNVPFDVNILVYTPRELEKMRGEENLFLANILPETQKLI